MNDLGPFADGQFHHVAMTHDRDAAVPDRIYVDGDRVSPPLTLRERVQRLVRRQVIDRFWNIRARLARRTDRRTT